MAQQLPQFLLNPKRKNPPDEEPQGARYLAPEPIPLTDVPEPMPMYSDTDPGAQGNYQQDPEQPQLPQFARPVFSDQSAAPQPEEQPLPVYQPVTNAVMPPDAAQLSLPKYRVDSSDPAPLMVVKRNDGAPTERVIGDGSRLDKYEAELDAQRGYTPKNHNSRLRSILIGGGRGFLRGGILSALFGAVSHGVKPSLDEEYAQDKRVGELGANINSEYGMLNTRSKLADADVERRVKLANIQNQTNTQNRRVYEDNRDAALKNLQQFSALDPSNPVHSAAIKQAEAAGWKVDPKTWGKDKVQVAFDVNAGTGVQYDPLTNSWKPMVGRDRHPISTRMAEKLGDLPKHFYELDGQSKDTIYSDAKAKAGAKDYSRGFQIDPAKVALLTKDGEKPEDAMGRIKEMLNRGFDDMGNPIHFAEFAKAGDQDSARRYDAAVEAQAGPELRKLNMYQLAVDQTAYSPASSKLQSIDQFQRDYKTFWKKYVDAAKKSPDQADQMKAQYFAYIKGVRLR